MGTLRIARLRLARRLWLCVALAAGCEGAVGAGGGADSGADAVVSGDTAGGDAAAPLVPALEPLTREEAVAAAAAARRLLVVTEDGEEHPMAWAMVNWCCQERANALMYALATADRTAGAAAPRLDQADLTPDALTALADSAQAKAAAINITGPLATRQTLVLPDGTELPPDDEERYGLYGWSYHHGAVVNVEGEPRVIDLSVGDEPLTPEEWARGFVDPSVECTLGAQEEFERAWSYWLTAYENRVPGPRPERLCVYTISPIFTFRTDQVFEPSPLMDCPDVLATQTGAFVTVLDARGVALPEEELPFVTSRYEPVSEAEQCADRQFTYCDLL